jgi:hypothetical protein
MRRPIAAASPDIAILEGTPDFTIASSRAFTRVPYPAKTGVDAL